MEFQVKGQMGQAVDRAMTTHAMPAFTEVRSLKIIHPTESVASAVRRRAWAAVGRRIAESGSVIEPAWEESTSCVSLHYNKTQPRDTRLSSMLSVCNLTSLLQDISNSALSTFSPSFS